MDTRNAASPLGGPALAAGSARVFPLFGVCGIPASARAAAFNVTVATATNEGYLTLYPSNVARPLASTINFRDGLVRANNAVIGLDPAGNLSVYAGIPSGTVQFVLDVAGYFE